MPIETNLNIAPHWDDFSVDNEHYGVLFKPSVSVQTRELNTLQSILRNQIEKFGDAIFQIGTIIEGCNFAFYPSYPYAKIRDLTTDGLNVTMADYIGLFVKNTSNLQAIIVNTAIGFETTSPDLNTLYLSYRNSGSDSNTFQYTAGDVLTMFDSNTGIWGVTVNTAGQAFSNSDTVVVTSALAVNVTSGSFSNGEYITQPSTGANLQIIGIDLSSYANVGQVVLSLKPRSADLANATSNGSQWAVANSDSLHNVGNTAVGTVMAVIGSGATATVVTDGSGRIISVPMTSRGLDYTALPTVTVKSPNNTSGIAALSLVPRNFVTKVTVSNTVGSVGNGYAFGVSDGTIYQKGLFLKVNPQTIVVEKYSQLPNNVSVGFQSTEQIIDANIDTNLLDNALGANNYQAPGADRLKITPVLTLQSGDTTDPDFLPIVSWSEGNPYRQNQATAYSAIGDKIAQVQYETEGDFVISRFEVTSRSPYTSSLEGTKVSIVTNPGSAYIRGQRVFNSTNYTADIYKTTDTATSNNRYIALNYGNWIRIKEVGGIFQFSTGDTVKLYNTARAFISNTAAVAVGNTTPLGTQIGTARIRNMVHEFGLPGDANCTYKLYLFDIQLNSGANFAQTRAIAYDGTYDGISDVVLTQTAQGNVAIITDPTNDALLFDSGATTLKNATNVTYTYRTIDQTTSMANTGLFSKNISATPGETFPYTGTLTTAQLQELYVVPVAAGLRASANVAGSGNTLTTSANITGNSTTFLNDFAGGDYINIVANSTTSDIRRVISITNNTHMVLDANVAFSLDNNGLYRYFPKNAPLPLGLRSGLSANVSANQQLLTINLNMALSGSVSVNTAIAVNITRTNVSAASKTAARDQLVKIYTANNAGGIAGPWCLGVSDIFRLKAVYMDSASTINSSSSDVTSYFYIDHKQNEDYLDLGYLYLRPNAGLTIPANYYLLVQFDCFQASGSGFFDTVSYVGANAAVIAATDSTPLANLGSSVSHWEIPECIGSRGQYFDLNKHFDFRPIVANTVSPTTNAATAPLNPVYTLSFGNTADPANDKKFPLPDSAMRYDMEQYMARVDGVFADKAGKISIVRGTPATFKAKVPSGPSDTIRLVNVYLPPYPTVPANMSGMMKEILTTRIGNINYLARRQTEKVISIPSQPGTPYDLQPRRQTMADINGLERRIRALEYYGTLSSLQTDLVNRVVPSSVDGTVNRFKFGFFADDFSSGTSQDVTNPGYAARIAESNLTPPIVDWVVGYGNARSAVQPYLDFLVVSQPLATVPVSQPNTQPNTVIAVANTWLLRTDHLAPSTSGQIVLNDYAYPVFANSAGAATFYFHVPVTTSDFSAHNAVDPDNFFIYQGSTLICDAYNNAVALTSTDQAYLHSQAVPGNFFGGTTFAALTRPSTGWVSGSGKISFSHNPSGGNQYTILSARQSQFDHWIYGMEYPSLFGSQIVIAPSATTSVYAGHMDVQPATMLLSMTTPTGQANFLGTQITSLTGGSGFADNRSFGTFTGPDYLTVAGYYIQGIGVGQRNNYFDAITGQNAGRFPLQPSTTFLAQGFGITVYGLKPNTVHDFTINGRSRKARTIAPGRTMGADLISDQFGIMKFNYFYDGNTADQDIAAAFGINPNSQEVNWATQVAASVAQPIGSGSLSLVVSAPASSAGYNLSVVISAELALSSVSSAMNSYWAALELAQSTGS